MLLPGSSISADASNRGAAPPAAGADLHKGTVVIRLCSADKLPQNVAAPISHRPSRHSTLQHIQAAGRGSRDMPPEVWHKHSGLFCRDTTSWLYS